MFGWIFSSLLFPIIKFKVTVRKLRNYVLIETHPPHWLWSVPPMEASTGLRLLSRRLSAPQTSSSKTLFEQDFAEDPLSPEISLPLSSCKSSDKYEKFIVLLFHRQHRTRNVITNMWSVYGCFHGNLFMPSSLDITPESREQAWALKFCKRVTLNFWTLRKSSDCYLV